jgi:hypothetical protein
VTSTFTVIGFFRLPKSQPHPDNIKDATINATTDARRTHDHFNESEAEDILFARVISPPR